MKNILELLASRITGKNRRSPIDGETRFPILIEEKILDFRSLLEIVDGESFGNGVLPGWTLLSAKESLDLHELYKSMQDLDTGSGVLSGLIPCFATQAKSIICLACVGKLAGNVLAVSLEKTRAVIIASSFEEFWHVVYVVGEGTTSRLLSEKCDELLGLPKSLEMRWRELQSISDAQFDLVREV